MDALGLLGLSSASGGDSPLTFLGHYGEFGEAKYDKWGTMEECKRWSRNKSANPNGASESQVNTSKWAWTNYVNGANWDVKLVSIISSGQFAYGGFYVDQCIDQFVLYNAGIHTHNTQMSFMAFQYYPKFSIFESHYPVTSMAFGIQFNVSAYCLSIYDINGMGSGAEGQLYLYFNLMICDYLFN